MVVGGKTPPPPPADTWSTPCHWHPRPTQRATTWHPQNEYRNCRGPVWLTGPPSAGRRVAPMGPRIRRLLLPRVRSGPRTHPPPKILRRRPGPARLVASTGCSSLVSAPPRLVAWCLAPEPKSCHNGTSRVVQPDNRVFRCKASAARDEAAKTRFATKSGYPAALL